MKFVTVFMFILALVFVHYTGTHWLYVGAAWAYKIVCFLIHGIGVLCS